MKSSHGNVVPVSLMPAPLYQILGEVRLTDESKGNEIPRQYRVYFLIYMPAGQIIKEAQVLPITSDSDQGIQQIKLITEQVVAESETPRWLNYSFLIEKKSNEVTILDFTIQDVPTDPKPKVIFEDPIEIEPGSGH